MMTFDESKERFIQAWGMLGSTWGINRTMAQVHALLMIAHEPLSAEQIMDELQISRGNANMNIRALIEWGLVYKELKPGDRKEYFTAEKDVWQIIRQIVINRKKRELEPMLKVLNEVNQFDDTQSLSPEAEEFQRVVRSLLMFAQKADLTLEQLTKADPNWMLGTLWGIANK